MTLSSTPTLQAANLEMARAATTPLDMNNASLRELAQVSLTPGTPWTMGSLIGRSSWNMTLVVGDNPFTTAFGYDDGFTGGSPFGSLSPDLVSGQIVSSVSGSADDCAVVIRGSLPKTFWRTLQFRTAFANNPFATVYSADAITYNIIGGIYTVWASFPPIAGLNWAALFGAGVFVSFLN